MNYLQDQILLAKEIGILFKSDKREEHRILKEESLYKRKNKNFQSSLIEIQNELRELLVKIPNVPHHLVPSGKSE